MRSSIDQLDLQLLKLLKMNARMSYARLAEELGISESAVRKRIKRLIRVGVIKRFTIEYDLSDEVRAAVLVKTKPPKPVPEISREIVGIEGVDIVYEVTGENDILVILRAPSIEVINRCVDKIRSVDGVAGTNTMIIMRAWT